MEGVITILFAAILATAGWSIAEGTHEFVSSQMCVPSLVIGAILFMVFATILSENDN